MKDDLIATALVFMLIITFGLLLKEQNTTARLNKELKDTVNVVYYINDKLDVAYSNIWYLNEALTEEENKNKNIEYLYKLLKDLDRNSSRR